MEFKPRLVSRLSWRCRNDRRCCRWLLTSSTPCL